MNGGAVPMIRDTFHVRSLWPAGKPTGATVLLCEALGWSRLHKPPTKTNGGNPPKKCRFGQMISREKKHGWSSWSMWDFRMLPWCTAKMMRRWIETGWKKTVFRCVSYHRLISEWSAKVEFPTNNHHAVHRKPVEKYLRPKQNQHGYQKCLFGMEIYIYPQTWLIMLDVLLKFRWLYEDWRSCWHVFFFKTRLSPTFSQHPRDTSQPHHVYSRSLISHHPKVNKISEDPGNPIYCFIISSKAFVINQGQIISTAISFTSTNG